MGDCHSKFNQVFFEIKQIFLQKKSNFDTSNFILEIINKIFAVQRTQTFLHHLPEMKNAGYKD